MMKKKTWIQALSGLMMISAMIAFLAGNVKAAIKVPAPTEQFYVADFANVLSQETQDYIVMENDALFAQHGAQVVVVTVDFLNGYEIEDYAYALFNEWGIGDKAKNNGVLLLLVIGEENYWMMQGKGLENTLTSGVMKSILMKDMEPYFAKEDYDTGVIETFKSVVKVIEGVYGPADELPDTDPSPSPVPGIVVGGALLAFGGFLLRMFVILVVIIMISSLFRVRRRRRFIGPLFFPRPRYHRPMYRRRDPWDRPGPMPRGGFGSGVGRSSIGGTRSFSSSGRSSGRSGPRMGGGGSSRGGGAGRH